MVNMGEKSGGFSNYHQENFRTDAKPPVKKGFTNKGLHENSNRNDLRAYGLP